MSKYSPEQLKAMATVVIIAEAHADERCLQLYITIAARTGLDANVVRDRIRSLAHV